MRYVPKIAPNQSIKLNITILSQYNWTFTSVHYDALPSMPSSFPLTHVLHRCRYELGFSAAIALIAQIFFIHRCFVVSQSYVLVVICGLTAGVGFGAGLAASVGLIAAKYYT